VLDLLQAGEPALVPAFWSLEILNSLLIGEKKGRISSEQTTIFLDDLRALRPKLDCASWEQVCGPVQKICRDYRLTPYDALYVELALRLGCPLATLDQTQAIAAKSMNVECL
jgi:predicted nucleic acid-binding protein